MANLRVQLLLILLSGIIPIVNADNGDYLNLLENKPRSIKQQQRDKNFIDKTLAAFNGNRQTAMAAIVDLGFKVLISRNDWETAIKRFNQAWLINPAQAEPYWGVGAALCRKGEHLLAKRYFDKALRIAPKNARLINDYGYFLYLWYSAKEKSKKEGTQLLDESITTYKRAADIDPTFGRIYYNWAIALMDKGDYRQAWEKIARAEKLGAPIDEDFIIDLEQKMARP